MKITILPDPDCIELIRSEFKDMIIDFLKSVGISEKDPEEWEDDIFFACNRERAISLNKADSWDLKHTIELNEKLPPVVDVFSMKCYLPEDLFLKPEWVFKLVKEKYFTSFVISGYSVCCTDLKQKGLKLLPKNLLNLSCICKEVENLNEHYQELKNYPGLKSISFKWCLHLKDISLLKYLVNLQSLNLESCRSLENVSVLSELVKLQTLNLSDCGLIKNINYFPDKKWRWWYWKSVRSFNQFGYLSSLVNLQSLNLSGCMWLTDINSLSGLLNLQSLDLSDCLSLTDMSSLAGLLNLQSLNVNVSALNDINILSGLLNLQSLTLSNCSSLTDISSLAGLLNLQSLTLSNCSSLTDISSLAGLLNLQSLTLSNCSSLTDISSLAGLLNLQSLNLSGFPLTDISSLSGLLNLKSLDLRDCSSLTDISSLVGLLNLQSLDLRYCNSLKDLSFLSGLLNLKALNLGGCKSLTDISSLAGLLNLKALNLSDCSRILNYSSLKNCSALKELYVRKIHPIVLAELLCYLAIQRKDTPFISEKAGSWLQELKLGFDQNQSSAYDLACSLAQGIIMANLYEESLSFHQILLSHPDGVIVPWKIWFSANLKTFGWDKIQKLAELNQSNEFTFGAIAGMSSCLPTLKGDPSQIVWAKKWITEIHSLYNNDRNFLKPAAAEWCLALKRLGKDQLLREWIEKFTDPSDPSALDSINKVFSAYALDLNDSQSALDYALKINDPKLRDESILNLAQQFIKEGETTKAGEFLFLLTQTKSRSQFAYSLAEDAAYLKNDENAHRLLAACGDNNQSLACILDKIRLPNPASEILEIMNEKLSDESELNIPASLIMQESNSFRNTLFKIKDLGQLERIHQVIDSVMKSR